MISERPISPSLSQRVLTEIESALFEALKRSPEVFAAIWAIKESYMKASGLGLRALPDSFSVLPPWPKAKLLFKSYFIARPFKLPGARAAISYRLDGPRDFDPGPPLIWRAEPAIIKALKNRPNF
jgi:hypothetical protein